MPAVSTLTSVAPDPEIKHVSDTAFWVASFRALEGNRSDSAFNDPVAGILSGDRGRAIARSMSRAALVGWGVTIRTSAIDRLVSEALAAGVDTVLNLGAGLDSRPYRMALPETLRWVEFDFPTIVNFKNAKLNEQRPVCALERVGIDLRDRTARNGLISRYAATSRSVLVITEGFLSYFAIHEVAALASELLATSSISAWIQDFDDAGQRQLPSSWRSKLKAAPFLFDVKDWFGFFERYGWRSSHTITSLEESRRLNRAYPLDFPSGLLLRVIPKAMRQKILSLSGAVLMQRVVHQGGRKQNAATTWSFMGGPA